MKVPSGISNGTFVQYQSTIKCIKAYFLVKIPFKKESVSGTDLLDSQLNILKEEQNISVLCTCCFYILDYNPKLLDF